MYVYTSLFLFSEQSLWFDEDLCTRRMQDLSKGTGQRKFAYHVSLILQSLVQQCFIADDKARTNRSKTMISTVSQPLLHTTDRSYNINYELVHIFNNRREVMSKKIGWSNLIARTLAAVQGLPQLPLSALFCLHGKLGSLRIEKETRLSDRDLKGQHTSSKIGER